MASKDINTVFSDKALEIIRDEIKEAYGNEVYFGINFNEYDMLHYVDVIARGNQDSVPAIISLSLEYDAVLHNHPSGIAKPSDNDVILTEALYNICCSVEITLIDHIIIAKEKKYSFKKEGMIDFFKENLSKNKKYEGGTYA